MNESTNPEPQKKRGWSSWSIICKVQIIGALLGAFPTIGIIVFCAMIPPGGHQGFPDFPGFLLDLSEYPTAIIVCSVFGMSLNWFTNNSVGGPAFFPECAAVIVNTILFFIVGSIVGVLIKKYKNFKK